MSELVFREAVEGDLPVLLALSDAGRPEGVSAPPSDPDDPAYMIAFRAIAADPAHRLIVAEVRGEVVGTLQISIIPGLPRRGLTRGLLENIHVRADLRGQGVGQRLVAWAIEECRTAGCGLVQLTSDKRRPEAHRFYERLGFTSTHEGFKLLF